MPEITTPSRFVGCDVGKHTITIFDSASSQSREIENTPESLRAFAEQLENSCLVVCEATGGHEAALLDALLAAGVPAHRADARKVKAFIRSFGTLGKTDAIDARALARYGSERHDRLARWRAPEKDRARLRNLVVTRRALVDDRTAYTNRRTAPASEPVAACLDEVIACFNRQIAELEAEMRELLKRCEELARARRVLTSIPGIATTTAAELIALMPELGTLTRREAAALAGLAPHPKDSGTAKGPRRIKGGRRPLKSGLFMASLSAAQHHPALSRFQQRLEANGKKPVVIQTAVMRRLLVIANAKIRDECKNQN